MIALFGGSFDPPHLGHEQVITEYFNVFPNTKKLFIIPNQISPFKKTKTFSNDEILFMLKLMIQDKNLLIEISDFEIYKTEINYSIKTIQHFQNLFPNDKIHFLIGEDILDKFHLWKDYLKILELVKIIIFRRFKESKLIIPKYLKNFEILKNQIVEISSTEFKKNLNVELLNRKVSDFILNSTKLS